MGNSSEAFEGLTEEVASAAPGFAEVAGLGFLAVVFFGGLRSSFEAPSSFAVSFSLVGVLEGMVLVLLSVSFRFLSSMEAFMSGWENLRLGGGGFVVDMLMSVVVSEAGSRSATDFLLIIGRELSVQGRRRKFRRELTSRGSRRRLVISAGRCGVGRRPSTRFFKRIGPRASRYLLREHVT